MSTFYTIQVHHWFPRSDAFAKQKVEAAAQTLKDSLEGHTETSVLKQSSKAYVRTMGEVAKLLEPLGTEQRDRVLELIERAHSSPFVGFEVQKTKD